MTPDAIMLFSALVRGLMYLMIAVAVAIPLGIVISKIMPPSNIVSEAENITRRAARY